MIVTAFLRNFWIPGFRYWGWNENYQFSHAFPDRKNLTETMMNKSGQVYLLGNDHYICLLRPCLANPCSIQDTKHQITSSRNFEKRMVKDFDRRNLNNKFKKAFLSIKKGQLISPSASVSDYQVYNRGNHEEYVITLCVSTWEKTIDADLTVIYFKLVLEHYKQFWKRNNFKNDNFFQLFRYYYQFAWQGHCQQTRNQIPPKQNFVLKNTDGSNTAGNEALKGFWMSSIINSESLDFSEKQLSDAGSESKDNLNFLIVKSQRRQWLHEFKSAFFSELQFW